MIFSVFSLVLAVSFSNGSSPSKAAAGWMDLPWDFSAKETDVKVVGELPSWLNGSLYRNGPGLWRFGEYAAYPHWFGGLGFLEAFHFRPEQKTVSFYASFINTSEYNLYDPNHNYSSKLPSFNSQVTVRRVRDTLLANDGAALSNSFDPITTETLDHPYLYSDIHDFDPIYNEAAPSHAQTDPEGSIFHMLYVFGDGTPDNPGYYQLYHIPAGTNGRIMAKNKVLPNPKFNNPLFQHMSGLTEHFSILCEVPFNLQNGSWMPELGVTWYVVDRYTAESVATFTSDLFMYYHWANSFEYTDEETGELYVAVDMVIEANGTVFDALYIDNLIYEWEWSLDMFCTANLSRFLLPVNRSGNFVAPVVQSEFHGVEMPVIWYEKYNTLPYQYVYQVGVVSCSGPNRSQFWDALIKTEVTMDGSGKSIYFHEPELYVTEPIFVPRTGTNQEDDGVLLSVAMNSTTNSSHLLVLNATTMEEMAAVYPASMKTIPFGFHGRYYADF